MRAIKPGRWMLIGVLVVAAVIVELASRAGQLGVGLYFVGGGAACVALRRRAGNAMRQGVRPFNSRTWVRFVEVAAIVIGVSAMAFGVATLVLEMI